MSPPFPPLLRRTEAHASWARLLRGLLAALWLGVGAAGGAWAQSTAAQVEAIEARYGNQPKEVVERLRPLEAAARAAGGRDLRVFLAAWGYVHGSLDRPIVADAAVAELIAIGEAQHDAAALASAYTLRASMLQFSGRDEAADRWMALALPQLDKTDDEALRYWGFMCAGDLDLILGRLEVGLRHLEGADRSAQAQANPRRRAQARLMLAPLRLVLRDAAGARRDAQSVYQLATEAGDPGLRVAGKMMEAIIESQAGQAQAEARALAQAQALLRDSPPPSSAAGEGVNPLAGGPGWLSTQTQALQQVSSLQLQAGQYEAARQLAERALALANHHRDAEASAYASLNLGMALRGLHRKAEGERLAEVGLRALRLQDSKVPLMQELNRYGALLQRQGDTAGALAHMREALLLEADMLRSDRLSTVLELQRKSSFESHQRQVDQLLHDNTLQSGALQRHRSEQQLTLGLIAALGLGAVTAAVLYARVRRANAALKQHNATLAHVNLHDRVTGLPNRRAMEVRVDELQHRPPFGGVIISVKRFGLITGSLGHVMGDELLCQIAERLSAVATRHGGALFRLDGVSFGLLCPTGAGRPGLQPLLDELAQAMAAVFRIGEQELIASLAMGAAEFPTHGPVPADVARAAQIALQQARVQPGNSGVIYSADLMEHQRDRLNLERRLAQALEKGEFELHYQAQRNLRDGQTGGFEALLRWRSPEGMIGPNLFIPVAEDSGLIVPIGRWVVFEACRQARAWRDAGFGEPLMAINISPRQFQHPDFMAMVCDVLQQTGVNPSRIELEITEGALMEEAETTIQQLHALRALGLHLALDDFGTGYSSLSYLKRFPINRLKIDQAFIRGLEQRNEDAAIVQALIQLSHSLGLTVVAEGVETAEQEACLRSWDCDWIQGYVYARPAPAAQAVLMLATPAAQAAQAA